MEAFYDLARAQHYLSLHFFVSEVALLVSNAVLWTQLTFWEIVFPLIILSLGEWIRKI